QSVFDVLRLGMGPDAHVPSLFPEHHDQLETGATAVAVENSPKPPPRRISLTWPVLNSARHVAFLVAGADKAEAAARGHGAIDPWPVPASAARGLGSTTWYMDRDAAGERAGRRTRSSMIEGPVTASAVTGPSSCQPGCLRGSAR